MSIKAWRSLALTASVSVVTTLLMVFIAALIFPASTGSVLSGVRSLSKQQTPSVSGSGDSTVKVVSGAEINGHAEPLVIRAASLDEQETIDVYERYNEAVVNITTETIAMNWFFEPVPQQGGSGSGSIIDGRGYVLTNNHVVKNATKLYVNLSDGTRFEATVIGTDPENDLAVIKFDLPSDRHIKTIPYGNSASLKVGQKVLAIGNPFGLERTLTQGIISGIGRPVRSDSTTIIRDMIQTDASINPGNSGGPLLNARGEMIGVNAMIYSTTGGSVGIGFAVPVDTARRVVPELIANGRVRRGWIDMQGVQLFPDLLEYMKRSGYSTPVEKGLLVSQIPQGSNAEKAGLRGGNKAVRYGSSIFNLGGDIVVAVDGDDVGTVADLNAALEDNKPGEEVNIEFWRNGRKQKTTVILTERQRENQ